MPNSSEKPNQSTANSISNVSELLDSFSEAVLLVDDRGIIRLISLAAMRLTGYTYDQLQGQSVEQFIPERHRVYYQHYLEAFFKEPQLHSRENQRNLVVLKQDNQELPVDVNLKLIRLNHHQFVLINLYVADRQSLVEQNLHDSEERLLLAKQAAGLGIFDINLQYQIIYQDDRMSELWGGHSARVCSYQSFFSAIHPKDRTRYQTALDKACDPIGDGVLNVEVRVIQANNHSEKWVNSIGKVHFSEGTANRVIGIVQDITKQKILEKELQDFRSEAESLFKQQVAIHTASAIAHELNQPLTVISAYSEVALKSLEKDPNDLSQIKKWLQHCVTQAQRAGDSLHELIASLHNSNVQVELLNLNEVILEALHTVRSDGFSDFQQILQFDPNLAAVSANHLQIKKAIINLIRNAIEAMNAANITVSAITISVKTMTKENLALVTLEDKGPGVNPKIIDRIFDPFFTTKPTGIGMGLSISRALIEANGGQLWVDPQYPNGAKFCFTLPFAK